MLIRKLNQEEKIITRPLYEEAFPEDTKPLVDYYYRYKMEDNEVYAALSDGRAVGMLCLNPYRVMVRQKEYPLFYIVAVATAKAYQRKGIMRAVLTKALREQAGRGLPFTYLKPANPAYYTPFDFAFISRRPHRRYRKELLRTQTYEEGKEEALLAFMNRYLREHFDIYALRDPRYLRDVCAELRAGNGSIDLLLDETALKGVLIRDDPNGPEETARLLFEDAYLEQEIRPASLALMGRILSLPDFAELAMLDAGCEKKKAVHFFFFQDAIIEENNGLWRWTLDHNGSVLEKADRAEGEEIVPRYTPSEFARWMFGEEPSSAAPWCQEIRGMRGVYFDEET